MIHLESMEKDCVRVVKVTYLQLVSHKLSRQILGLTIQKLEVQIILEVSFIFLDNFLHHSNTNIYQSLLKRGKALDTIPCCPLKNSPGNLFSSHRTSSCDTGKPVNRF